MKRNARGAKVHDAVYMLRNAQKNALFSTIGLVCDVIALRIGKDIISDPESAEMAYNATHAILSDSFARKA